MLCRPDRRRDLVLGEWNYVASSSSSDFVTVQLPAVIGCATYQGYSVEPTGSRIQTPHSER